MGRWACEHQSRVWRRYKYKVNKALWWAGGVGVIIRVRWRGKDEGKPRAVWRVEVRRKKAKNEKEKDARS